MSFIRSAGILLHPTSLPGQEPIGTLGKYAFKFIDWLDTAGMRLWQILPLGPTGYGDSPYASFSSFAGNPLLIDLSELKELGLLSAQNILIPAHLSAAGHIDFGSLVRWKIPLLKKAAVQFLEHKSTAESKALYKEFEDFKKDKRHLHDYAVFMSIKEVYDKKAEEEKLFGKLWNNYWPKDLARHNLQAVKNWETAHATEIEVYKIIQFFFFRQWAALRAYAAKKNIAIIGDIPIFVAPDSSDVWANQEFFQLDENGQPLFVAGVPPDYFSKTGQLWGNPVYNWQALKKTNYAWWIERVNAALELVDYIRIDHFRGFESYWAVPFGAKTAEKGSWEPCPGKDFFLHLKQALAQKNPQYANSLPIIAEDLGVITEEVRELRDSFGLPGMKILQFAFNADEVAQSGYTNTFLPHNYTRNSIVYTGTHDNTTLRSWVDELSKEDFQVVHEYLTGEKMPSFVLESLFSEQKLLETESDTMRDELAFDMIKLAFMSVAVFAIIPLQDVFLLGKDARMNSPSTLGGNWTWRCPEFFLDKEFTSWLSDLVRISGRESKPASLKAL
ncbi:4-alpha-glucanotransferase [Treponema phagedenis]|uniref:4-alpha-glucanotransferase n=1 Tax=Treponema phagedenis TaxID=162 RepID=UPI0001F64355|nr:4-alpha-glucanotransferase [Treponema phagedenis]EFW38719.1 4-alpha-glucanotransferase [Treponema phagedenis F0421]TYT79660.1 4-alpha-glucanotransferase [Treponema phagedenis]